MIPGKILRFLQQYATLAFAGTRDRNLVPHGHRVSGWRVDTEGRRLTAFVAAGFETHLIEALEDNGAIALTVEEFPSHETYQFKGRYLRQRPLQPEDVEIVNQIRARFVKNVRPLYSDVPEDFFKAYVLTPGLAIEFEVEEVYLQTPGPGAGTRLVPAPEAK